MSAKNTEKYKGKNILAPMVKVGTLATRLLALRYGADLVYSEELVDWKILKSKRVVNEMLGTIEYQEPDGTIVFSTCKEEESKVIMQIGTSDAERALQVLLKVQEDISGIDVNMGCPKDFSLSGGMGAALLKKPEKVKDILTTLVTHAKIPVTCKIRVLDTLEETLELASLIQSCGVSALGIHGRTVKERPRHQNRNDFIKAVAEKLDIPIIANGGSKEVKCYEDIEKFREAAGSSSVMLARIAQWNPSIFRKEGMVEMNQIIKEFLKLSVETNNPFTFTKYTIQGYLRELQETPFGKKFLACPTVQDICGLWDLKEFYDKKMAEWEANKRPLEDSSGAENESKKVKRDLPVDSSIIVVPDCTFIRGHYDEIEQKLPKTILIAWTKDKGMKFPKYTIECSEDRRFRSVVNVGGKDFMTDVWEKNKKNAEQAAALACVKFLKLA